MCVLAKKLFACPISKHVFFHTNHELYKINQLALIIEKIIVLETKQNSTRLH